MRIRALVLVASLTVALAACGSGEPAASPSSTTATTAPVTVDLSKASFTDKTASKVAEVNALDNTFEAQYTEIKAGTTVRFRNSGHNEHNVVALDKAFKGAATDKFEPDTEYTVTFDKPGDYPYYCSLHGTPAKGMSGAIRVVK